MCRGYSAQIRLYTGAQDLDHKRAPYRHNYNNHTVSTELPDKAGEVVVLELPGQHFSGELKGLPDHETVQEPKRRMMIWCCKQLLNSGAVDSLRKM